MNEIIEDINNNITNFSQEDLKYIYGIVSDRLKDNKNIIVNTLEDTYKLEIVKELYEKYTWEELEVIKKKINI